MPIKLEICPPMLMEGVACTFYGTVVHLLLVWKQLLCHMEVDRLEVLSSKFRKICSTGRPCNAALFVTRPEVGDPPLSIRSNNRFTSL